MNIPPDGMVRIDTPAVEYYRLFDSAFELAKKGQYQAAVVNGRRRPIRAGEWQAIYEPRGLAGGNRELCGGIPNYQKAIRLDPQDPEIHMNFGLALANSGRSTRPLRSIGEPWRSILNYPRPTTTSGSHWHARENSKRPSGTIGRPSPSTRGSPRSI